MGTVQKTIRFTEEEMKRIDKMARKHNVPFAEMVRKCCRKSVDLQIIEEQEAQIMEHIREVVRKEMSQFTERMIKITVKGETASTVNMLMLYSFIHRMYSNSSRRKAELMLDASMQKAIQFIRLKDGSIYEYIKRSAQEITAMLEE